MGVETVARRYASALADIALASGTAEEIKSELNSWQNLLSDSELGTAFGNPTISHASKEKVLEAMIGRTNPSKTTANFLRVLVQNSRIGNLDAINERLSEVLEQRGGVISGSVLSARELSDAEKASFAESLGKTTGKEVRLTFDVDPEVIGGAITRVGSTVYDGSVRSQLENLKEKMIKS